MLSYQLPQIWIGTAESPSFAPPQSDPFGIVPGSNYFPTPALADLDGDGDVDLISSTYDYSYANGNPQFAEPTLSPFGLAFGPNVNSYISFPSIADLDSDGDLDLLCSINGEYYNNGIEYEGGIFYFENTGDTTNPQFEVSERNPVGISIPNAVYYQVLLPTLADLDGDGDNDFLGCAPEGDFYYYENTLMVSTTIPQADFSVNIFPNSINNYLNIDTNEPLTQIEIYDLFGRQLATYNGQQTQISIKDLSSGTYMIRLINQEGQYLSKRIEKL